MSVPRALDWGVFVDSYIAGLKRAALPHTAGKRSLLQHQTGDNDALASALADASAGEQRHANAICANVFDLADALDERICHAGRIDQVWQNFVSHDHPPSGVSSAAFGRVGFFQIGSDRRVKGGEVSS